MKIPMTRLCRGLAFASLLSLLALSSCSVLAMGGNEALNPDFPFFENFESAAMDALWYKEIARPTALTLAAPPVAHPGGGSQSCKVNVAMGEIAFNGNRAEMALYRCAQYKDTMYFAYDYMIPTDDPDEYSWQIMSQWYQLPDFAHGETFDYQFPHPPVTIVIEPGIIKLMANVEKEEVLAQSAWTKGQWYRVIVGIRFDVDRNGWVEAWYGPAGSSLASMGRFNRPTLYNKAGAYFKMGLYRGGYMKEVQAFSTNSVWFDKVALSRDLAEVQ